MISWVSSDQGGEPGAVNRTKGRLKGPESAILAHRLIQRRHCGAGGGCPVYHLFGVHSNTTLTACDMPDIESAKAELLMDGS